MQLHSLTLRALGPFRDQQRIDFAGLTAGGLFLLDGPTGAGKSTLIDAVVFALYGQVAGGHSSKQRLVSDHRDADVEPFVDLIFETGHGIFRIRRTPAYERPKKRGEGTIPQQASVKLWRGTSPAALDGDPVSVRAGEADAEIRDAIGLSRDQFVRTVVLPQGEFARFLQAKSDERREILQSIFGTEHYEGVQADLLRRRAEAQDLCRQADHSLGVALDAFVDAAFDAAEVDAARETSQQLLDATLSQPAGVALTRSDGAGPDLPVWCADVVAGLAGSAASLDAAVAEAAQARESAAAVVADLLQRHERRERLRTALAERSELDAERDDHLGRADRLELADRAARCRGAFAALDDAALRLTAATRRVQELRTTVELTGLDLAAADHDAVAGAHRTLRDEIIGLTDVHQLELGLPHRHDELRTTRRHREKFVRSRAEIAERCAALPAEIAALTAEQATAASAASTVQALRREQAELTGLAEVHLALEQAGIARDEATEEQRLALRRLSEAAEGEADLRRRYLDGIAAEIAEDLTDGAPCRVCGSPDHPDPARRSADHITREQVESAERARADAQSELDEARATLDTAATAVAELAGRLDGRTGEDLLAGLATAASALAEAEAAENRVAELTEAAEIARGRLDRAREHHAEAEREIAVFDERLAGLTSLIERDEARVVAERGEYATVGARVDDLERRASGADQLAKALAGLADGRHDHARRAAELAQATAEAGFGGVDDARQALLPESELREIARMVERWRRRDDEIRGRLDAPDLADLDPDEVIDVGAARKAVRELEAEYTELQRRSARSSDQVARARAASDKVGQAVRRRRRVHADAAPAVRLAGLVSADSPDNGLHLTLATYVLQRRFDRVVEAANERLVTMSAGRYSLEPHEGKQSGTRRTGLGLRVVDSHTGRARDTGTLSGGETFYASLSLALGLADVVTSESGGLQMGTLFVDEGFGSLDAETLDHVMGVLAALRSGGRVVGVVSHVEELKTRIPERVEVRRSYLGGPSTITVVA